ncbi:hypothetical protein SUGI_1118690 [Cryptomeria japonica]|nr:hypothetical protein SUGI_1118690 [Cryptomeria japonica]
MLKRVAVYLTVKNDSIWFARTTSRIIKSDTLQIVYPRSEASHHRSRQNAKDANSPVIPPALSRRLVTLPGGTTHSSDGSNPSRNPQNVSKWCCGGGFPPPRETLWLGLLRQLRIMPDLWLPAATKEAIAKVSTVMDIERDKFLWFLQDGSSTMFVYEMRCGYD